MDSMFVDGNRVSHFFPFQKKENEDEDAYQMIPGEDMKDYVRRKKKNFI